MTTTSQPEHLVPSALVGLQNLLETQSIPHSERVYMLRDPYQLWLEPEMTITRDRTERTCLSASLLGRRSSTE